MGGMSGGGGGASADAAAAAKSAAQAERENLLVQKGVLDSNLNATSPGEYVLNPVSGFYEPPAALALNKPGAANPDGSQPDPFKNPTFYDKGDQGPGINPNTGAPYDKSAIANTDYTPSINPNTGEPYAKGDNRDPANPNPAVDPEPSNPFSDPAWYDRHAKTGPDINPNTGAPWDANDPRNPKNKGRAPVAVNPNTGAPRTASDTLGGGGGKLG